MSSIKWFRILCSFLLMLILLAALPVFIVAQEATPIISLNVTANSTHVNIISGETATITMTLDYTNTTEGAAGKAFDLIVTIPSGWSNNVTNSSGQKVSNLTIIPGTPSILTLSIIPPTNPLPEAGDYQASFQVTSGDLKSNVDIIVTVTAKYGMTFVPSGTNPVYSTHATAGKSTIFSVTITNTGSAAINNVAFTSDKPLKWEIDFPDNLISSLGPGDTRTMDVKIIPASDALTGDYLITLKAKGTEYSSPDLQVRVTVDSSSVWAWVGVIIIVIVVVALAFLFVRFSRR
jgi:uncharacterized membrane protein